MQKAFKYNFIYRWTVIVWLAVKWIVKINFFLYRHSVWDGRVNKKWEKMLEKFAREYRIKAERLGGLLIKVGQFMSTRTDILPDAFIDQLTGLVDDVSPLPFEYAEATLREDWGDNIYANLKELKKKAVASASIGEVFYGVLKDGSEVAIKVRRHRIDEIFHKDFVALRMVFWLLRVFTNLTKKTDLKALYHEIVIVMSRELDYTQELAYGNYFYERYQGFGNIHIPYFYEELSTERVLVMEWIDGVQITNKDFVESHQLDKELLSKTIFDFYLDQFLNPGKFHADPHPGNVLLEKDGRIAIIDFGMVGEIKKQDTEYFKLLVQGFIIDNYDIVVDALDKMEFLLPQANKKKIKETIIEAVELYSDGSLKNLNAQTVDQLFEEFNTIMQEEAIQLPADYTYLIRAISIVAGIVFTIYPDVDIVEWGKPKIRDWFGKKSIAESIAKQYVKNAAEPILSYPRALLGFLENGKHDRKWDREKTFLKMKHQYYLLLEVFSFMMVIAGLFLSIISYAIQEGVIAIIGLVITVGFLILLNVILLLHRRMIKKQNEKGV